MADCIIVGSDVHDKNLLLKVGVGSAAPETLSFANTAEGRRAMLAELRRRKRKAKAFRVVFAYEASGAGYGLCDDVTDAGCECHVLAPTRMKRSHKHRRMKTDERDAEMIFEHLRAHILAGNDLAEVWVPDAETRDDRELVRSRIDAAEKLASLKTQVQCLLKRNGLRRPKHAGRGWTEAFRKWLFTLAIGEGGALGLGALRALETYLRQAGMFENEIAILGGYVAELAQSERYRAKVETLVREIKGVGVLVAMVFLTEMGDLSRFNNRRQVAAYVGLVPSSDESGEGCDRKGHITHQGSWRLRKVLCQAAWSRARTDEHERAVHARICAKNPKHKKIATVALMRRLVIRMWHAALRAARGAAVPPQVDSGPVSMMA